MKTSLKPMILAAALAGVALGALAHGGSSSEGRHDGSGMTSMNPERHARMQERMQDHMAKRAAELKAELKLSPEQESSWSRYLAAMKPPASAQGPRHEDLAGLSTPERLDKMRELRRQRDTEFDRRDAATRSFYAGLSSEQKKVFDDNTSRRHAEGRRHGPR
jgi:periplasmic protein CpxP/Spy